MPAAGRECRLGRRRRAGGDRRPRSDRGDHRSRDPTPRRLRTRRHHGDGPLLGPAHDPHLVRRSVAAAIASDRASASGSVMSLPPTLDDQVALGDPRPSGRAAVLDAAHQEPVPLRQADRGRRSRPCDMRDGAIATPRRGRSTRLATAQRIDPLAERGVGREREVEPSPSRFVLRPRKATRVRRRWDRRTSRRASGAVCSTLPQMRRPPGPRNARRHRRDGPERSPVPDPRRGRRTEDHGAGGQAALGVPGERPDAPAVSTSITASSPSTSTPASRPAGASARPRR